MSVVNPLHKLGNLCRRGHDHEGSGQSVRFVSDGHCVACHQERVRAHRAEISAYEAKRQRDNPRPRRTGLYLGRLCKRGHEFEQTGQSQRYADSSDCVTCVSVRNTAWCTLYPERRREHLRRSSLTQRLTHPEQVKAYRVQYQASERGKNAWKRFRDNNPQGYERMVHMGNLRRAARKRHAIRVRYTFADVASLMATYGGRCAYCGQAATEMDHVVALAKGGHDALYNLAPACRECNGHKAASPFEAWYVQQPFFSAERLRFMVEQQVAAGLPHISVTM